MAFVAGCSSCHTQLLPVCSYRSSGLESGSGKGVGPARCNTMSDAGAVDRRGSDHAGMTHCIAPEEKVKDGRLSLLFFGCATGIWLP
jgi:hypothetical protein